VSQSVSITKQFQQIVSGADEFPLALHTRETISSLPFGDGQSTTGACGDPSTRHFTGKERDAESGLDYFGARYDSSNMGRFMTPDPSGAAFSILSAPQSWNLYSYVQNNPLSFVDPDGRECVWEDGSFDSKDDPKTGSYVGCSAAGGVYYDPQTFTSGNGQDWSSAPSADLAQQYADAEALRDSQSTGPDSSSATGWNTSTSGRTTTINLWGLNWMSTQVNTGTHPFRDNNPGDIVSGPFTSRNGEIGSDGRFAVFPAAATGRQAMDTLLHGDSYINLSINAAVARYAPAFENNTAAYQQFLTNALGVSGNTPLSSLSPAQFQTLENAITRVEGFDARGNYSVTTTSVVNVP
jgi:RHS repeat-associated protein